MLTKQSLFAAAKGKQGHKYKFDATTPNSPVLLRGPTSEGTTLTVRHLSFMNLPNSHGEKPVSVGQVELGRSEKSFVAIDGCFDNRTDGQSLGNVRRTGVL